MINVCNDIIINDTLNDISLMFNVCNDIVNVIMNLFFIK